MVPSDLGHNPELASDGSGFLSVMEVGGRIRAVRVDDTGRVLDPDWLDFGVTDVLELYPSVAFGGGHYLVTWSDVVTDSDGNATDQIRGRLVGSDGTIVGEANLTLSSGQATGSSVSWDGQHFVLAYVGLADGGVNDIHSVLINPDGTRVAGSEHTLTTSGSAWNPHLAAGATSALVVWEDYVHSDTSGDTSTIHGVRLGPDGAPLDTAPFALSTGARSELDADVAAGPAGFLVVWQTSDADVVRGSLVSAAGSIGSEDFAISHGTAGAGLPSAVFDGTDYVVGWTDGRDEQSLYGTHVSTSGDVGTDDTKIANDAPLYVGFASDHTNFAWNGSHLLFTYLGTSPNGIEGSLLGSDLTIVQNPIALSAIPSSQGYPQNVFDGQHYVVAWTDERDSNIDMSVRAVRISGTGGVLDSPALVLSTADKPAFGFGLGTGLNGSSLVVWSGTDNQPQQRLVSADGTLGSVGPFTTQNGAVVPSIASNGHGYLTVFNSGDSSDTGSVYGHLLDQSGQPGAEFRIDASTLNTGPSVVAAQGKYVVVYARSGLQIVSVSDTGSVGTPIELTPNVTFIGLAGSDTNALVTWNDDVASPGALNGRFVASGAFSGDTFEIGPDSAGYGSAVAWDGSTYWAVWESATHALLARSIDADGTLGAIATVVEDESYAPVLASDGHGQLLLSYAKLAGERRSRRVVSRIVGRGAAESTGGSGGTGGGAGSGSGGTTSTGAGGTGGTGSGSGGTTTGSGGTSSAGASTGGTTSTGGSVGTGGASGSGGMPMAGRGGAGGRGGSAGTGGSGGSGGSPGPLCSVTSDGNGRSPGYAAVFGLAWALVATRRRRRVGSRDAEE